MDVQLKKGLLEILVLASLRREPSYGYKIISDVSPYMAISESTLYPILRRLEQSGALKTTEREVNGRVRKYYAITPRGVLRIEAFREEVKEFNRVYRMMEREDPK